MDFSQNLLSILIWLPIIGGVLLLVIGDDEDLQSSRSITMRTVALGTSLLTFVISIGLYKWFDTTTSAMQFVERVSWVPSTPR